MNIKKGTAATVPLTSKCLFNLQKKLREGRFHLQKRWYHRRKNIYLHVDHIEALYLGGDDDLANYNPACRMCNFYKSTKSLEIFRDDLAMLQRRLQKIYIYRLALRYGLIKEEKAEVTFYFEKE